MSTLVWRRCWTKRASGGMPHHVRRGSAWLLKAGKYQWGRAALCRPPGPGKWGAGGKRRRAAIRAAKLDEAAGQHAGIEPAHRFVFPALQ